MTTRLNLGIVGACGRGASFKSACDALGAVSVHAICDIHADSLDAARERLGAREQYTDYETMLDKADLDAVIIGTPMQFHAPMAIAALERNISVLSEGTDGCYESGRAPGEKNRVWLRTHCPDVNTWMDLAELADEFLPDFWKQGMEQAKAAGHGGGDYFEILDFVDAIQGRHPSPIDIDAAMDMTMPGLVSQQSIAEDGRWIDVPDSRNW